jgi:hypothetical protein
MKKVRKQRQKQEKKNSIPAIFIGKKKQGKCAGMLDPMQVAEKLSLPGTACGTGMRQAVHIF